MFRSPNI